MRISYLGHDTRRAVDETHDESLSASGETLPQGLSPALLDLLAPLLLELVVEGEGGEALAQSARYLGESSRRASDDAGKNAPTKGKKWLFVHGASPLHPVFKYVCFCRAENMRHELAIAKTQTGDEGGFTQPQARMRSLVRDYNPEASHSPDSDGETLGELAGPLDGASEGLVKEVFDAPGYADDEPERVPDDVKTQDEDVELLDGLAGVVAHHLVRKVAHRVKLMLALEVGEAENDVVGVGDGHAEALQEEAEEVGPARWVLGRLVGGQREAEVQLEWRHVQDVIEVLATLGGLQLGDVPQRQPGHLEVLLEEGEDILVEDLLLLEEVVVSVDESLVDLEVQLLDEGADVLELPHRARCLRRLLGRLVHEDRELYERLGDGVGRHALGRLDGRQDDGEEAAAHLVVHLHAVHLGVDLGL